MSAGRNPRAQAVVHEVQRTRLLKVLTDTDSPVVVISAPAGAGKSTVAQQWMARDARTHVTLRLAPHLDDPALLSESIIHALEMIGPPAPQTKGRVTGREPTFSATLLPALTRLAGSRGVPFVLVIDDLHVLRSTASHQVIEAVCEGTPTTSAVVLLTRDITPAWLARTRASGRLTEVSAEQLNFDVDEAAQLLSSMGLRADTAQLCALVEHTEGWPVGLYLSCLSLSSRAGAPAAGLPLVTGSDRHVADYLRTQVLDSLSEDEREFLMLTSIVDELSGPLCDAILERTDSAAVLARLHENVQLVIAVDRDESRYRCHHLLAEELVADLRRLAPALIPALQARASASFSTTGDREAAIRHATASGDVDLMSRTIWPEVAGCVASGRLDRLRSWLGGLTDMQISSDPWLSMAAAWASLQQGDATAMGRWVRVVEAHAGSDWRMSAPADPYAATLAVLHELVGTGGLTATCELADLALQGLAPDDQFRAPAAINRAIALTLLHDPEGGRLGLLDAERTARELGVPIVEVNARSWLGLLALANGEHERGIALIASTTDLIRDHSLDRLATGALCMTAQALVLALRGDRSAALTTLGTARRLTGLARDIAPWFAVSGRVVLARAAILLGDGATARQLITEAETCMTAELRETTVVASLREARSALTRMSGHGAPTSALTTSELRVLQFLPSHLTFAQIGEHLFVSQSTVKTHVLSIYRKFGVGSRSEAVERAREAGLVESPVLG